MEIEIVPRASKGGKSIASKRLPFALIESSGVYICKSIVNDLRQGNYICKSGVNYLKIGTFIGLSGMSNSTASPALIPDFNSGYLPKSTTA